MISKNKNINIIMINKIYNHKLINLNNKMFK